MGATIIFAMSFITSLAGGTWLAVREAKTSLSLSRFKNEPPRPLAACKELALIQPLLWPR
jgi:hypothetical protein